MIQLKTDYLFLRNAWVNFKKGKHPSSAIDELAYSLELNLTQLSTELSNGSYKHGNDFTIFCPTVNSAYKCRELSANFLRDYLDLTINPKNDIVVSVQAGLKFLGHNISKDTTVVDKHTTKSVLTKLDWYNAASYKALPLSETDKVGLDWILLEKYVDV